MEATIAIAFSYTESTNLVEQTGGTSGTPATFASFVTADRAGYADLLPAVAVNSDPTSFSLTYAVRPVEDLAVRLRITTSADVGGATLDIDGDDWQGNHQDDNTIDISGATTPVITTTYWSAIDASGIIVNGIDDGTTITVEQEHWGVIWDKGNGQYQVDAVMYWGSGSTPSYFASTDESIIFTNGGTFRIVGNAIARFGNKVSIDEVNHGSYIYCPNGTQWENYNELYFYGCLFINATGSVSDQIMVWTGASFEVIGGQMESYIKIDGTPAALVRIRHTEVTRGWACLSKPNGTTLDLYNVRFVGATDWAAFIADVPDIVFRDSIFDDKALYMWGTYTDFTLLIDCTMDGWNVAYQGTPTGKIYRQNTCNIHVSDKDGTNLSGVTIVCEDVDGNTTGGFTSVNTDANGDIAEQTISRGYCTYPENSLDTDFTKDYSPHKFTISYPGLETMVLESITVDSPISWQLELQPMRARNYARSRVQGVQFQ